MNSEQRLAYVRGYIEDALIGFEHDPADSDFQRGYQAALETVIREAFDLYPEVTN